MPITISLDPARQDLDAIHRMLAGTYWSPGIRRDVVAEALRNIAIVLQPFCPDAAGRMLDQLAVAADARDFAHIGALHSLKPGIELPAPSGVFPRIVEAAA